MGYCRQHGQLESQHTTQHQAFSPSILTQHGTLLPAALSGARKGSSGYAGRKGASFPTHSYLCPLSHSTLREQSINTYMHTIRHYLQVSATKGQAGKTLRASPRHWVLGGTDHRCSCVRRTEIRCQRLLSGAEEAGQDPQPPAHSCLIHPKSCCYPPEGSAEPAPLFSATFLLVPSS